MTETYDMEDREVMKFFDCRAEEKLPVNEELVHKQQPIKIPQPEEKRAAPNTVWIPEHEVTYMDRLRNSVKWMLPFGALNMTIFYWMNHDLMAQSIAIPCMWACVAIGAFGVGKSFKK